MPKTRRKSKKEAIKPISLKIRRQPVLCKCSWHGHPLSMILYIIGTIVIIYGAWFHELLWLVLGFVPSIIGIWWEHIFRK